ncbi:PilX N-terminal domain-containing pilus assembly protein [Roseateles asaccharophilus]|uniref:Tfp pilus assembly protein PilX n=1 Tax=Roseateles asaccharophilus TaxID=582607 RepID=A0ABU2A1J9_9BURK|nr:PilX N-terminal domain-containing pilus assembly protein [Roseateles asaccharophilus]MDR7331071.1 Tfp pilus assembly protein PilX [Roseateles asaccharophilus]
MNTHLHRPPQRGLVLVLALIVLAALSLAAVGLMRGVFASNRVAGNLAYQQSAVQAAEVGVERAVAWLEQQARATVPAPGGAASAAPIPSEVLYRHAVKGAGSAAYHYSATRAEPGVGQSWENFWQTLVAGNRVNDLGTDATGNNVAFAIHRLCSAEGRPDGANCEASPDELTCDGCSKGADPKLEIATSVYYRITVRVQGPRNATSFIQAVVSI